MGGTVFNTLHASEWTHIGRAKSRVLKELVAVSTDQLDSLAQDRTSIHHLSDGAALGTQAAQGLGMNLPQLFVAEMERCEIVYSS